MHRRTLLYTHALRHDSGSEGLEVGGARINSIGCSRWLSAVTCLDVGDHDVLDLQPCRHRHREFKTSNRRRGAALTSTRDAALATRSATQPVPRSFQQPSQRPALGFELRGLSKCTRTNKEPTKSRSLPAHGHHHHTPLTRANASCNVPVGSTNKAGRGGVGRVLRAPTGALLSSTRALFKKARSPQLTGLFAWALAYAHSQLHRNKKSPLKEKTAIANPKHKPQVQTSITPKPKHKKINTQT